MLPITGPSQLHTKTTGGTMILTSVVGVGSRIFTWPPMHNPGPHNVSKYENRPRPRTRPRSHSFESSSGVLSGEWGDSPAENTRGSMDYAHGRGSGEAAPLPPIPKGSQLAPAHRRVPAKGLKLMGFSLLKPFEGCCRRCENARTDPILQMPCLSRSPNESATQSWRRCSPVVSQSSRRAFISRSRLRSLFSTTRL